MAHVATNLDHGKSSIPRRTANHHGNVWDDDLIQALHSPYGRPEYSERADELIKEIQQSFFSGMEDRHGDLIKRLQIVECFECLGIARHFQREIQFALDFVYRCWNELKGIGPGSIDFPQTDLNATALAFRALRLHRYSNISSGVFENFKGENGHFFCSSDYTVENDGGGDKRLRSMVSLLRASNISFPGEKVMDEATAFTTDYLNKVLLEREATDVDQSLFSEVKYALEFPWHCSPPRWEARNFIEIYRQNYSWLKLNINQKILELAILDFNILQSVHQKEIQLISRWWRDKDVAEVDFFRKRHVEYYFVDVIGIFEPQFSQSRIAFVKTTIIMNILDDLYDTYGTLDELRLFTDALKRQDLSFIETFPESLKMAFKFIINTWNDLTAQVVKMQGRDMSAFIQKNGWEQYVEAYLQDAEWIATKHMPTFSEYLKNGKASTGMCVLNLYPLLLMGELLPHDILEQIYSPSKIHELLELTGRLTDDARDFQDEKEHGQIASGVECYVNDHPGSTIEDALNNINDILDHSFKELNWELLKHDAVPLCCKKFSFGLAIAMQFFFKYRDGFSISNKEIKDQISKVLIEQVPF
eukprot:PITA_01331